MMRTAYNLFDTPIGTCGIAWKESSDSGTAPAVTLLQLPEATPESTESRIARNSGARAQSPPPPRIAEVIRKVSRHLGGDLQDFREIEIDLDGSGPFARQVYEAARRIPAGRTRTYGELAKEIHRPRASRAVGQALGRNPIPLIIPCHRVLASGGKPGGFSAFGGFATKARMLSIEGTTFGPPRMDP